MKRTVLLILAGLILASPLIFADAEATTTTLSGDYWWSQRDANGELEAVFTPAGENKWTVDFHFQFRGEDHTYSGTAEGSLSEGELKGEVRNENKKRTFVFSGSFQDGKFKGDHAEIRDGSESKTGMLELAP